jgi:hypothetical protein
MDEVNPPFKEKLSEINEVNPFPNPSFIELDQANPRDKKSNLIEVAF